MNDEKHSFLTKSSQPMHIGQVLQRRAERIALRTEIPSRDSAHITVEELRLLDGRLETLERIARRLHVELSEHQTEAAWHGYQGHIGLKHCITMVFGWFPPGIAGILNSVEAYDLICSRLLNLLEVKAD